MANRLMNLGVSATGLRPRGSRRALYRGLLLGASAALTAGYLAAAYVVLPDELPSASYWLSALGFVVLALSTYVLASRPVPLTEESVHRLRQEHPTDFGRQLRLLRARQHRTIRIPAVGELSARLAGGLLVLASSAAWWLSPWGPVRVVPPNVGDLTAALGEDLAAVMLVLPDDHMVLAQPPVLPATLKKKARLVRDDADPYSLAIRALGRPDFGEARRQLDHMAASDESDPVRLKVAMAQIEMYAGGFTKAVGLYKEAVAQKPDNPMLWCQLAAAQIQAGHWAAAQPALEQAQRLCRQQGEAAQRAAAARQHLASLLAIVSCRDFDEAVKSIEDSREPSKKAVGEEHPLLAANMNNQAVLYVLQANAAGAEPLLRLAESMWTTNLGAEDSRVAAARSSLARLKLRLGDYTEAETLLDQSEAGMNEAAPADHPARIVTLNLRAAIQQARGDFKAAKDTADEALAVAQAALGSEHPWSAAVADHLAILHAELGWHARAYQYGSRALVTQTRLWGPRHPFLCGNLDHLAGICVVQKSYREASECLIKAEEVGRLAFKRGHPLAGDLAATRGRLDRAQGRASNARKALDRARQTYETAFSKEHPSLARVLGDLASLENTASGADEGIDLCERAIEILERTAGEEHPEIARLLTGRAALDLLRDNAEEARLHLERAVAIEEKRLPAHHPQRAATLEVLATALATLSPQDTEGPARLRVRAAEILARHQEEDRSEPERKP